MLPTTYRGDATVDGEQLSVELRLDENHVRLITGRHAELLSWPLALVSVETNPDGGYRLNAGTDSFDFSPLIDDGLGDEIALRTRFASIVDPQQPAVSAAPYVSDRVRSGGRRSPGQPSRSSVLSGGDLALRTALVVLGILAVVVVTVAAVSGAFQSQPATIVAAPPDEIPASTLPFTESPVTVPEPEASPDADLPVTQPPATQPPATQPPATQPPATAAPTTTTVPPPTTTAPVVILPALDLTPEQLRARWDDIAGGLDESLQANSFSVDGEAFTMVVNDFVTVSGNTSADGSVESLRFVGDPSGTVADDRLVITAMGISVAMAAPDLNPSGRRALLDTLGFDVDSPSLAGLDGVLTYRSYEYQMRWDDDIRRIVFDIGDIGSFDS